MSYIPHMSLIEIETPWAPEGGPHDKTVLAVSAEAAQIAIQRVVGNMQVMDGNGPNGQKNYKSNGRWISVNHGSRRGKVYVENNGTTIYKHPHWWRKEDREKKVDGEVPPYSVYTQTGLVRRDIDEERTLMTASEVPMAPTGCEIEMVAMIFGGDGPELVDIQHLISALKVHGVSTSIEGWRSQLEHPSEPRGQRSVFDHRSKLIQNLHIIDRVSKELGITMLPLAVMPTDGYAQPNLAEPHVQNVLMSGISAALGRQVTVEEAASMLTGFRANGLHVTAQVQRDRNGLIGDNMIHSVFSSSNGGILPLMKALTHSGNLSEPSDENVRTRCSWREQYRKILPTAQVGIVNRLLDPETIQAVEGGAAPSLERGSLCDENGRAAAAVHNPLGRQKEWGGNELTIFDVEGNVDKIIEIEVLHGLFTAALQRSLLRNDQLSLSRIVAGMSPQKQDYFVGCLTRKQTFMDLIELVDRDGYYGKITWDGKERLVGEVIVEFISFVERFASSQGLTPDQLPEEYGALDKMKERIINVTLSSKVPQNFYAYFNPSSDTYAHGSMSLVAQNVWNKLRADGYSEVDTYRMVLEQVADARSKHLSSLYTGVNSF